MGHRDGVCATDDCDKPTWSRGFCKTCYANERRNGSLKLLQFPTHCQTLMDDGEACGRRVKHRGLCQGHATREVRGQDAAVRFKFTRDQVLRRDDEGRKQCSRCLDWHSEDSFRKKSTSADGLHSWCGRCIVDSHHHLSVEHRRKMLTACDGRCFCGETITDGYVIDHDHACCSGTKSCGACIRGLICQPCNKALGFLRDSTDIALAAARYLQQWSNA